VVDHEAEGVGPPLEVAYISGSILLKGQHTITISGLRTQVHPAALST